MLCDLRTVQVYNMCCTWVIAFYFCSRPYTLIMIAELE